MENNLLRASIKELDTYDGQKIDPKVRVATKVRQVVMYLIYFTK